MLIGGLQKTTLIDYPDKVAATIFTIGCNFRCSFCHNPEIVKGISRVIPVSTVLNFLKKRKNLTDAVCITGGEPTVQNDLISFVGKLKDLDYLIKIDTNGSRPEVLENLVKAKLVDYLAMDIKFPWEKYPQIIGRKVDLDSIKKSVIIIKESGLPHEFRSTVLPRLHSEDDIVAMAEQVKGADKFFLQQFRPAVKLVNMDFISENIYTKRQLQEICRKFEDWFGVCRVR
ncbi:anaerobic ribonucleoside-triphosphate reductase activating protein [Patescibacteria group bacterium]|nr:anaerobic ribonucleoside-triphosphate reductase activating protein [Patescibacteria group bacterium]